MEKKKQKFVAQQMAKANEASAASERFKRQRELEKQRQLQHRSEVIAIQKAKFDDRIAKLEAAAEAEKKNSNPGESGD